MTAGHTDMAADMVGSELIQEIFWREKGLAEGLAMVDERKEELRMIPGCGTQVASNAVGSSDSDLLNPRHLADI